MLESKTVAAHMKQINSEKKKPFTASKYIAYLLLAYVKAINARNKTMYSALMIDKKTFW